VLKDGASAIYGSDAVAGVVNFILLNGPGEAPYEGAEIDMLYGNTTDTDARVLQAWIRGGVSTDKVSVAAAAEYYDREGIFSRDREISASSDRRFIGGANTGSPTFPGRVTVTAAGQVPPGSGAARILIDPSTPPTGPESYRAYGGPNSPDPFNFREFTPAIPAMEKYQYYVTGRYKVFGEALQLYADLLYSKRKQDNGLAPAPFGLIAGGGYRQPAVGIPQSFTNAQSTARQLEILRGSPFNPFGNNVTQAFYRSVNELGLRRSFFDYDYYRYVAGFNGNFTFTGNNFISFLGYDTGMVYERGDYLRIDSGDARRGVVLQEVIAGRFNPFIGLQTPTAGPAPTFVNGVPTGMTAAYDNTAALQNASYIGRTFTYAYDFLADAKVFGNLFPNLYQEELGSTSATSSVTTASRPFRIRRRPVAISSASMLRRTTAITQR
jgi:outer membrane receptor protein involved in Fe transport